MAARWDGDSLILDLRVQPRASGDAFAGTYGNAIKVRITAPPVDGQANQHLLKWIAGQFGVAKSRVTLISGETGRDKRVGIESPARIPDALPDLPGKH